jgi:hypothetical protein
MRRFRSSVDHVDTVPPAADSAAESPSGVRGRLLRVAVERALRAQQPRVTSHIAKVRRKDPGATPAQVIEVLGRRYQLLVTGIGAAGGGIAIVPAVGTVASLATATTEAVAALDAAVLYTLAVAEVHRLPVDDVERRRALVLGVVMGEGGTALMNKVTGGKDRWARSVTEVLPLRVLGPANNALTRWFVKRYLTRQVALAVGRALPFGVGVLIGAVGNVVVARAVIRSAERAFGPPPARWPEGPTLSVPPEPEVATRLGCVRPS